MKTIIKLDVPEYQIGQEVSIYFKDTMMIKGIVQEPKTGYWIDMDEGFSPYECYECKSVEFKKSKYCPNCGCRMVEPQESEVKE